MLYAKAVHDPEAVKVILWNKIRFIILNICNQTISGKPKGKTLCLDPFLFSNVFQELLLAVSLSKFRDLSHMP